MPPGGGTWSAGSADLERVGPGGRKARIRTGEGESDLRAVGLVPDRDHGLTGALDQGEDVGGGGAGRKALVNPEVDSRRLRDRGGGLAGAQERAREDGVGPLRRQALAERARFLAAAGAERAQLVRVAGVGVSVADEDQSHEGGG